LELWLRLLPAFSGCNKDGSDSKKDQKMEQKKEDNDVKMDPPEPA